MQRIKCPNCGAMLETVIDLSEGAPNEAGIECEKCGGIAVFDVIFLWSVRLGEFLEWERKPITAKEDPEYIGKRPSLSARPYIGSSWSG